LIDQDAPHRLGCCSKEVTLTGERCSFRQSQIGFMHQGGGIEGLTGLFVRHLRCRETAQLVIDQR
jgi:hypothetical protein